MFPEGGPSSRHSGAANTRVATGVVLMAYGTPRGRDQIEPYYTDIRRGRPPTPEQLADLVRRYAAIGGTSPLAALSARQRDVLQAALDERAPGEYVVALGFKHAPPKIEQAVADLVAAGVAAVVGLALAPHYSALSVGEYLARARSACNDTGTPFTGIESWAREPAYVEFLARAIECRLADLPAATAVVFTAHSLPQRILDNGDPYPDELRATAEAVAERLRLPATRWSIGWQSAGRTPEPWIGPDILTVIDDLAATRRVAGLLVCPCGFVADHLEVLYDLDIEARRRAAAVGLAFDRTSSANDDPAVLGALADRVMSAPR